MHSQNKRGTIAQLVEQRTENPCVPGSIPGGTTYKTKTQLMINQLRFSILHLPAKKEEGSYEPSSITNNMIRKSITWVLYNSCTIKPNGILWDWTQHFILTIASFHIRLTWHIGVVG